MMNRFSLLVCDYDGTLATGETAASQIIEALTSASEAGKKLILATGRELPEICRVLPEIDLFQWVVAENGAVLFEPATGVKEVLGTAPPESFFQELRKRGIGAAARGEVIAAVSSKHAAILDEIIRALELPYHVILNKNSAMVLPSGVDKGTAVAAVMESMEISVEEVVAVGDGENDEDLFRVAGFRVAVANAVPELKASADMVTTSANGAGVMELIDALLEPAPIFIDSKAD
jgi:phosphoglycolate phosphatase (TIGR01487 family)